MSLAGRTISHYKILAKIGEGGMGEVYKAEDTRLDRVVALKFLAPELTRDPAAKTRFVQEAKAASALDHPNVCTIHEIDETEDGHLFIAMAHYDGDSLKDLIGRGRLEPEGAVAIAQQVVQGLQQAHDKGIVHRDVKPGNILITGDGIVKVVDFGLAKLAGQSRITQTGAAVGTLAYMAPEQVQGEQSDHRADIWSVGVTLYEMVTGHLPFRGDRQQALAYSIVNQEPIPVSDWVTGVSPELERMIGTCLKRSPAERYQGLSDLMADLQAVAKIVAPTGVETTAATLTDLTARLTVRPYPGLASFTEAEAAYFHGRESEVETVWGKLQHQMVLAIIGPSGAGKTSFLRAGLMPARPGGWGVVMCTPGSSPFLALRQALVPELAGDTEAIRDLLGDDHIEATVTTLLRWRRRCGDAVLILDQFEELFTLNLPEVQERFADLLGRLSRETGVHVLFSMRDDFLFHCHAYPGLAGVFEAPVPLGPLSGAGLRRALIQPAANLGYRFEDDALADEMLAEVESERGALPLLAFAVSRLWEKRDRERRLLTRHAYDEIGGVAGALAQHAEATMDRIGLDCQPIVRELFRNLVTAQVTRVARERDELLSLFDEAQREAAADVLQEMIHARLLTSYEVPREDAGDSRRVEIVHESLLSSWPRLVRWQTQDADSAQFHDQVRQAADMWDGKSRADDLLWSGTLYNEFVLWHERYPGGLTDTESEFSRAMVAKARQKKRRRVAALSAVFVTLVIVLAGVTSLWQRSEVAQQRATAEANKAEASLLVSLGREAAADDPTEAFAYALASLEREDTPEARHLALESLAEAPLRFEFRQRKRGFHPLALDITPDGKYFAVGWAPSGLVTLHETVGDSAMEFTGHTAHTTDVRFSPSGQRLATSSIDSTVRVWSIPDGKLLKTIRMEEGPVGYFAQNDERILTCNFEMGRTLEWHSWPLGEGEPTFLGREGMIYNDEARDAPDISPDGRWISDYIDNEVFLFPLDDIEGPGRRRVGAHDHPVWNTRFDHSGRQLASVDNDGWVRVWDLSRDPPALTRELKCPGGANMNRLRFDPDGRRLATAWRGPIPRVWDLESPADVRPLELKGHTHWTHSAQFLPDGRWLLSTGNGKGIAAWPLTRPLPVVFENKDRFGGMAEFLPDGSGLVTIGNEGDVWLVPLASPEIARPRLLRPKGTWIATSLAIDPTGRYAAATSQYGGLVLISIEDGRVRQLPDAPVHTFQAQFSADSRLLTTTWWSVDEEEPTPLQAWDVETGEKLTVGPQDKVIDAYRLTTVGRLLVWCEGSVWAWDLETGDHELVREDAAWKETWILPSGRRIFYRDQGAFHLLDLDTGETRFLYKPEPKGLYSWAVNKDETLIAVCMWFSNTVEIIPTSGGEPYVLYGFAEGLDFDPQGRYLAASNEDGKLHLWPIPEGKPKHTMPRDEFIEYLRSHTTARAVPDTSAASGFRISYEPFAGWDAVPQR